MGRLAGFRYRDVIRKIKKFGFEFYRQAAGSHEIWYNPITKRFTTISNHPGDVPEGTLKAILMQADINIERFLSALSFIDNLLASQPASVPKIPIKYKLSNQNRSCWKMRNDI